MKDDKKENIDKTPAIPSPVEPGTEEVKKPIDKPNRQKEKLNITLTKEQERIAIEMGEKVSEATSSTEEWYTINESIEDGKSVLRASPTSTEGCSQSKCDLDPKKLDGAKVLGHLHVNQPGGRVETLARELPGPGDHLSVIETGIPSVIHTPEGRTIALEIIEGVP